MLTCQFKAEIERSTLQITASKSKSQLCWDKTAFSSSFSLIGRTFSIFRQKMDRPNPSEMDINVFIPAPRYCLQFEKVSSMNAKGIHFSSSQEKKRKYRMHEFRNENSINVNKVFVRKIFNYHPGAHLMLFIAVHQS